MNYKCPLYVQFQCFLTLSILHCFTAARAITPDEPDDPLENAFDAPDLPPSPPSPEGHGRQKSSAALRSFEPSAFLARISAPMSQATADVISDVRGHYDVPEGDQAAGVENTGWYRAGLKRKAADISRTQYEVYSFSTKNNLSEAAVDELLEMLSNVCTSFDQSSRA